MNGVIIDWSKLTFGSNADLLAAHYAFLMVLQQIEGGALVEDLKLMQGEETMVTEEGFREFLKGLLSVPWDDGELTEGQIQAANEIAQYLAAPYEQAAQPMQAGGLSLAELKQSLNGGA